MDGEYFLPIAKIQVSFISFFSLFMQCQQLRELLPAVLGVRYLPFDCCTATLVIFEN